LFKTANLEITARKAQSSELKADTKSHSYLQKGIVFSGKGIYNFGSSFG
jgi:hypothetical protein